MRHWAAAALAAMLLAVDAAASTPAASCAPSGIGIDSFCTIDGVRIHYVDWGGHGPAIILLAGLGDSARIFDDLAPRLAKDHRVIAVTRRGYGQSDQRRLDYSNRALVGDILGLMDRLSIARAAFVGHSIAGGELSTLGADHPSRVERLIYLDAAYDHTRDLELTNDVPGGMAPGKGDLASLTAFVRWREGALRSKSPAVRDDIAQTMRMTAAGLVSRTPTSVMLSILNGDVAARPRYAAISAPALAVYSSKDVADQVPAAASAAQRRAIVDYFDWRIRPWMLRAQADFIDQKPCGVAVELPHSTHYFFLRSPGATARMVLSYLAAPDPCHWRAAINLTAVPW
jgi:pimeloyl-ACP methyl ester carboxylesterase